MQNEEENKVAFEIQGNGLDEAYLAGTTAADVNNKTQHCSGQFSVRVTYEKYIGKVDITRHISKDSTLKLKSDMEGVLWKWTNYWTGLYIFTDSLLCFTTSTPALALLCVLLPWLQLQFGRILKPLLLFVV